MIYLAKKIKKQQGRPTSKWGELIKTEKFHVSVEMQKEITNKSVELNISKSELVRRAVDNYLQNIPKEKIGTITQEQKEVEPIPIDALHNIERTLNDFRHIFNDAQQVGKITFDEMVDFNSAFSAFKKVKNDAAKIEAVKNTYEIIKKHKKKLQKFIGFEKSEYIVYSFVTIYG